MRTIKEVLEAYRQKLLELYKKPLTDDSDLISLDSRIKSDIKKMLFFMTRTKLYGKQDLSEFDKKADISEIRANDNDCYDIFNEVQKFFGSNYRTWTVRCNPYFSRAFDKRSEYSLDICELVYEMRLNSEVLGHNQRIAQTEAFQDKTANQVINLQTDLMQVTSESLGALTALTKTIKLIPEGQRPTEVIIETDGKTTTTRLNLVEKIQEHSYVTDENKYLTKIVPNPRRNKIDAVRCAKETTSFVQSNRRAACSFLLMRYLFKLNGIAIAIGNGIDSNKKLTNRGIAYHTEFQNLERAGIDPKFCISACVLFLFMEYDKSWEQILSTQNPASRLMEIARQNELPLLRGKLKKITKVEKREEGEEVVVVSKEKTKHVDIHTLSDKPSLGDDTKGSFYNAVSGVMMFFAHSPFYAKNDGCRVFREFSTKLYEDRKLLEANNDIRGQLEALYNRVK